MALNSTCEAVLSCGDSPLSVTGSSIGILTFAYALIITILYRTRELGNADQDIPYLGRQIEESRSFASSVKWMQSLYEIDDRPIQFRDAAVSMVKEAEILFHKSQKLLRPSTDGDYPKWRLSLGKSRFLSRKTEIQRFLGDILQVRSNFEARSQELASRIMLEQVQRQSEKFESYRASMENQKAMLRRIMNSLQLKAIEEPSERGLVPPGMSNELEMVDMNMELRPPTQWDPPGPPNGDP